MSSVGLNGGWFGNPTRGSGTERAERLALSCERSDSHCRTGCASMAAVAASRSLTVHVGADGPGEVTAPWGWATAGSP